MVLVDTNTIIDFWKNPNEIMREIFLKEDILMCGIVKAELLYGARSKKDYESILAALAEFQCVDLQKDDWVQLGQNLYELRINGVTVPFQDAAIATLAMRYDAYLWTADKHFDLIQNILPNLKLYEKF